MDVLALVKRELCDPFRRPRGLSLLAAATHAVVGAVVAVAGAAGAVQQSGFGPAVSLALAALFLVTAYGLHWNARYVFSSASRAFFLGSMGGSLGVLGAVVLPVVPLAGLVVSVAGVACAMLAVSWGNFVYTYRKYRTA
ncbi:MAG: hypothetical protein ABEJ42_01185 [Halobacteriaceae archaeon]